MTPRWTLRIGNPKTAVLVFGYEGEIDAKIADVSEAHLTQSHQGGSIESLCGMNHQPSSWSTWIPGRPFCQHCLAAMANGKNL